MHSDWHGVIFDGFKKTIGFEVKNAIDLLSLCGCVGLLDLSAWRFVRIHITSKSLNQLSQLRLIHVLKTSLVRDTCSTVPIQLTQQPVGLIESPHRIGRTTRIRMFL